MQAEHFLRISLIVLGVLFAAPLIFLSVRRHLHFALPPPQAMKRILALLLLIAGGMFTNLPKGGVIAGALLMLAAIGVIANE